VDKLSPDKRSRNMSRIKGKDTKPEVLVRSLLHAMGYRFRLHDGKLPGKPDIILPRFKAVILVHGCFWHGHKGCKRAALPTTRASFWAEKISGNIKRDERNIALLEKAGYRCLVLWQCEMKVVETLKKRMSDFLTDITEDITVRSGMARRSKSGNPDIYRRQLIELLESFGENLKNKNLRDQVLQLIPAVDLLQKLGCSLAVDRGSARNRILDYLRKHVKLIIAGEELKIVAGISEYARRIRELRVQDGWRIISGLTAKDMEPEDIADLFGNIQLKADQYILLSDKQDLEAACRWRLANEIRKDKTKGTRDKILAFLRKNVGKEISGEELRYIAGDKSEWARRVRELRTECGWLIMTHSNGRPDLPVGLYVLENETRAPEHDRKIPDNVRRNVLVRDKYACNDCGWTQEKWTVSDARHLEAHHLQAHAAGGSNNESNLVTLCNICHDKRHSGKT
jgi:DNA mismatch endonuclease Vsr